MKFPYQCYEIAASPLDGTTELFRPEILLHLIGESGDLHAFGLLDTGADGVVVGRGLTDRIGVRMDESVCWPLRGFGDHPHSAVLGHVDVELMSGNDSACWRMPVGVVTFDDPAHEEIVLLGQTGFLQFFDVRFHGHQHIVELDANESFPKP